MLLLLLALHHAPAVETAWLAPTLAEHNEHADALDEAITETAAVLEAIARMHNTWTTLTPPGLRTSVCEEVPLATVGLRAEAFLAAAAPSLARLTTRLERHIATATAPTVAPLLHPDAPDELAERQATVARLQARLAEAAVWQTTHVSHRIRDCQPPDTSLRGIARDPYAEGPVAVLAAGGGVLCPPGVPADGRVVVMDGPACIASSAVCGCVGEPARPGAVLLKVDEGRPAPEPTPTPPPTPTPDVAAVAPAGPTPTPGAATPAPAGTPTTPAAASPTPAAQTPTPAAASPTPAAQTPTPAAASPTPAAQTPTPAAQTPAPAETPAPTEPPAAPTEPAPSPP
jgi:hypothetical protein